MYDLLTKVLGDFFFFLFFLANIVAAAPFGRRKSLYYGDNQGLASYSMAPGMLGKLSCLSCI